MKKINLLSPVIFLLSLLVMTACVNQSEDDVNPVVNNDVSSATFWRGANITFTKDAGASAQVEANQDRITDNVWITRGNGGGEIYNAKSENNSSKGSSPTGTEWAVGSIDNAATLKFQSFRATVGSPKSVVGKNLVLHLIQEDIYISVTFTSWSSGKNGGFAYERSTQ